MPEPVTCLDCGMVNPPPEQTCVTTMGRGRDHFVGHRIRGACRWCGRLAAACRQRPCQKRQQGWRRLLRWVIPA